MNMKTLVIASVLAALLMGLPLAGVMEYGRRKTEPRRTELANSGVKSELDAFITQHSLSQNDMRFMVYRKPLPFLNAWLSYAFSIGFSAGIYILIRRGLIKLIGKQNSQQGGPGYPPQGVGSPDP